MIAIAAGTMIALSARSTSQTDEATRTLAHDIFKQLIEINTTDSVGNVTTAAQAMAQRLLDAGFPAADITVIGPNDRIRSNSSKRTATTMAAAPRT